MIDVIVITFVFMFLNVCMCESVDGPCVDTVSGDRCGHEQGVEVPAVVDTLGWKNSLPGDGLVSLRPL